MLRGRLPDFGYGCDLVVGENQHFELKLNERIIQERLGQKKAVSRLASSIGKHKNQNKFIKMFKDDNVSIYYEDIQRLKDHYTNINEIINVLKENPNLERFKASNGVNPGKKFARKKSEDYSMPLVHQNTIRVNNETMSPVFVSKLPPFNSGDGQRLNKTFLSTKRSNNSKASVNRMVYTQNRKLRKAHIQALSSKQLNELQNKGKKRVKEVRRNEQNSSLGSITNLMNTYFKSFNFDHQNTTKKEKAFLKFGNILKKEFQNETVKKTVFKWCSNVKRMNNSNNSREFKSLETPREVRVVKHTLQKLKKTPIPDVRQHKRRFRKMVPNTRNCFSVPRTMPLTRDLC
ncbi:unnamed protein product [Moneuplotes crassus]|uniref:Uncharacterized protein n=1 Tax=Euplotes crassus TaxID=5936 RepID=A0AAD1U1F6_EUPCR|nr:unnamed protein product [Moneuplotes crassus]